MKHYGNVEIAEGAKITNATIAHGTSFPSNPNEGEMFWRSDENKLYVYDETTPAWLATSGGLQNIVEDTTPQLGGDLDVNGKTIFASSDKIEFETTSGTTLSLDLITTYTTGRILLQKPAAANQFTFYPDIVNYPNFKQNIGINAASNSASIGIYGGSSTATQQDAQLALRNADGNGIGWWLTKYSPQNAKANALGFEYYDGSTFTSVLTAYPNKNVIVDDVFYIDSVNDRVGIKVASPQYPLDIYGSGQFTNETNNATLFLSQYSDTVNSRLLLQRAQGSLSVPTAVTTDKSLGIIGWRSYDGTSFSANNVVQIGVFTSEDQTTSGHGAQMRIYTTAIGATTLSERIRILDSGNVGINTQSPTYKLHVNGSVYGDNLQFVSGVDSLEWFGRSVDPSNAIYYKLATLPISDAGNFATFWIDAVFSRAQDIYHHLELQMKNRLGFSYKATYTGTFTQNASVQAYENVDGTLDIWLKCASQYYGATVRVTRSPRSGGGTIYENPATGTPTGTLVLDTSDTVTYDIIKMADEKFVIDTAVAMAIALG